MWRRAFGSRSSARRSGGRGAGLWVLGMVLGVWGGALLILGVGALFEGRPVTGLFDLAGGLFLMSGGLQPWRFLLTFREYVLDTSPNSPLENALESLADACLCLAISLGLLALGVDLVQG